VNSRTARLGQVELDVDRGKEVVAEDERHDSGPKSCSGETRTLQSRRLAGPMRSSSMRADSRPVVPTLAGERHAVDGERVTKLRSEPCRSGCRLVAVISPR